MTTLRASLAVIGGSGLYALFDPDSATHQEIETPYGPATLTFGKLSGRAVAFLPRHGSTHSVAPHLINYRANIWALGSVGVRAIVSTAAVGAVDPGFPVGSLVLTDQYIDRTQGRASTFYDRDSVQHLASSDPFCPILHSVAVAAAGDDVIAQGTVVVIQGPRFSTRAESQWFRNMGGHIVNMTLYPEVPLAAELNIGTINVAYITDNDATASDEQLSAELVFARLKQAQPRIIRVIEKIVARIDDDYSAAELIAPADVDIVLARSPR